MISKLYNLAVRCLSLGIKFLFVIIVADVLPAQDLGVYGLYTACITFLMFILGADYYTYCNRDILSVEISQRSDITKHQFCFYGVSYFLAIPVSFVLVFLNYVPAKSIWLFYFTTVFEHLNQEFYRYLVTFEKQIEANVSLFIRSSIWPLIIIAAKYFFHMDIDLSFIFTLWFLSDGIAIVYCVAKLQKLDLFVWKSIHVDVKKILLGLKVSFPFFISTIAYKIIEYGNRFIIDGYLKKEDVGAFTVLSSIANVMSTIVYTVVVMYYYPKLIKSYTLNRKEFDKHVKDFLLLDIVSSVVMFIGLFVGFRFISHSIHNRFILQSQLTYIILLVSQIVYNISLVPHYVLYSQKKDTQIMLSTIVGMIVNIFTSVILVRLIGMSGVAWGGLLGYVVILLLKYLLSKDLKIKMDIASK